VDEVQLKVSVVIPVYNPGRYIDDCIQSMLEQSLPADEYEVLFVDDGSTDDTPARLDRLAAEHSQVRVVHIPNSGWPGKPRNVGVNHARGVYVQFVDQDDTMTPEALERLYDLGAQNDADIVIGKVTSDFRGVPHGVFRHTRDQVTIHDFPLIDSLTPHKMFRRDFLREHGIAFPEGKRRLEDQLYMVRAYFPAKTVSILGDYPCYFYRKRDDGKNAGTTRIDPHSYYANLREILDTVIANTQPGEFRDKLLRRFYRVEMLGRLSEPSYLKHDDEFRGRLFSEVHQLAADYITDGVERGLGGLLRLRSVLLRANRPAELLQLATRAAQLKGHGRLETLRWKGEQLHAGFSAWFDSAKVPTVPAVVGTAEARAADGSELFTLLHRGDRYFLDPQLSEALVERLVDVTTELPAFRVQVSLRNRETAVEWIVPAKIRLEFDEAGERARPVLRGIAILDPGRLAGGQSLERGMWDVWLRPMGAGLDRRIRLGGGDHSGTEAGFLGAILSRADAPTQLVVPYLTEGNGNLSLDIDQRGKKLSDVLRVGEIVALPGDGRSIAMTLPFVMRAGSPPVVARLGLQGSGCSIPAQVLPGPGGRARLTARTGKGLRLPSGTWELTVGFDGEADAEASLGRQVAVTRGRMWIADAPRVGRVTTTARYLVHTMAARPGIRRAGRHVLDRMPRGAARRVRATLKRLG
jgi:poly(ribitol-phosphate) beta-N-acetylglucosaminyltransferase